MQLGLKSLSKIKGRSALMIFIKRVEIRWNLLLVPLKMWVVVLVLAFVQMDSNHIQGSNHRDMTETSSCLLSLLHPIGTLSTKMMMTTAMYMKMNIMMKKKRMNW